MIQVFRVELESIDITDHVDNTVLSKAVNRFYDVAELTINDEKIVETILGKNVTIFFGDNSFSGFIYSTERVEHESYRAMLRTFGAKLSEPFSSAENVVDNASTASELCSLYSAKIGYPISYLSAELTFGGSYERAGTYLTALTSIANTTGAEYYDDGTSIVIEPNKAIGDDYDHVLAKDEYFNYISENRSLFNAGVGTVRTSTGAVTTNDIIEENKINMEVFDDGTAHVYCIPMGTIEKSYGIELDTTLKTKAIYESATLINESVLYLKTSIANVVSLKLNGIEVSNYEFVAEHSVIYFAVPQTGFIEVTYSGYYQVGVPAYTPTPNGDLGVVDLYYLNQRLNHAWYVNADGSIGSNNIYIDSSPCIYKGFNVYMVGGGIPRVRIYSNGELFEITDTYSVGTYASKSNISLDPIDATTDYEYRIPSTSTVELITSFGVEISGYVTTIDGDEKVLTFDKYYPQVELSITDVANIVTIAPTTIEGEILLTVTDVNTGVVSEFDVCNIDMNDINQIPCVLEQDVPVDIVQLTGLTLTEVAGKVLPLTLPTGEVTTTTVGADGICRIWVATNGVYTILTVTITGRTDSYIELTAQV